MQKTGIPPGPTRHGGRRKGSGKRADASAPWSLRAVQALADGSRWAIINYLSTTEATVGGIASELGLSIACISKHISILKDSELVLSVRRGRAVVCRVAEPGSRAGELLAATGVTREIRTLPLPVDRLASAVPELESTRPPMVRYQSKDMDDFLL